ncbi:hypothetical protein GCM10025864_26200 [Luteimicrobium album]|uniref:Uncharacterized protein n=1 Tax=Luteimicrobium album TaxID=1054550 RepID=A0ABQ6I2F7_9MICO|nr:hypothetical protein [Luteimicrobium album]GMA24861.1 hypothetical protein GCM10025864_26200 [Luteimicrobium album]
MDAMSLQVALVSAASKCGEPTGPCAFSDRWADFYASYVAPARDVTVPALCVFFAILVLARLVPVVMPLPRERVGVWDRVPSSADEPPTSTAAGNAGDAPRTEPTGTPARLRARCGSTPVYRTVRRARAARRQDPDSWVDLVAWPRFWRRSQVVAGLALACAASLALVLWLPGLGRGRWLAVFGSLGAALAAAGLLGTWLGSRLRLTIDAATDDGTSATSAAAHIAARVADLGASSPRGLELPRGTDTSALVGSVLGDLPESKLVQAAVRIVQGLFGTTPWRADVNALDQDTVSVVLTRNGRQAASAVVDRQLLLAETGLLDLDPDAGKTDLHRFVAALIVVTLARYRPREFAGLCGASEWRSLGLYDLASTRYGGKQQLAIQRRLLARAVELDPGSWLAQLSFRRACERYATTPRELARYRRWLDELLARDGVLRRPGFESLRLRALYTCLSLSINARFASAEDAREPKSPVDDAWQTALADATRLLRAVDRVDPRSTRVRLAFDMGRTALPLARTVRAYVGALERYVAAKNAAEPDRRRHLRPPNPDQVQALHVGITHLESAELDAARRPTRRLRRGARGADRQDAPAGAYGTKTLYNLGCYYASKPTPSRKDRAEALHALGLATQDPTFRSWAVSDPQLAGIRADPSFWYALGLESRTDFLDLLVVAPFADRLRGAGLTTAREIEVRDADELAELTGAHTAEVSAILELAALRGQTAPPYGLGPDVPVPSGPRGEALADPIAIEVLHVLLRRGCASRHALARLRGTAEGERLVEEVVAALRTHLMVRPGLDAALADWLGLPRTSGTAPVRASSDATV